MSQFLENLTFKYQHERLCYFVIMSWSSDALKTKADSTSIQNRIKKKKYINKLMEKNIISDLSDIEPPYQRNVEDLISC